MIYLFPAWDTGKGPKQSTATRSKAPSVTGRDNKGAFGLCFGSFLMAQFTQDLHQSAQHPCTYHTSGNVCGACHMSYVHLNALHAVPLYAWREARQYLGIQFIFRVRTFLKCTKATTSSFIQQCYTRFMDTCPGSYMHLIRWHIVRWELWCTEPIEYTVCDSAKLK